jgi:hypothetical protein
MTPEAFRLYDQAIERFEADVRHALAVQAVEGREVTGTVDALTPDLTAYLVTAFKADDLKLEQEVRWTARPLEKKLEARQRLEENCRADLLDALQLRALGDLETILSQWSGPAFDHAKLHGFLVDREGPEFTSYVRAFHDAQIETWQAIQGHKLSDNTAGEGYGDLSPLGFAIDQSRFEGLDLSRVQPRTDE